MELHHRSRFSSIENRFWYARCHFYKNWQYAELNLEERKNSSSSNDYIACYDFCQQLALQWTFGSKTTNVQYKYSIYAQRNFWYVAHPDYIIFSVKDNYM